MSFAYHCDVHDLTLVNPDEIRKHVADFHKTEALPKPSEDWKSKYSKSELEKQRKTEHALVEVDYGPNLHQHQWPLTLTKILS
jgi:hypothetical protein